MPFGGNGLGGPGSGSGPGEFEIREYGRINLSTGHGPLNVAEIMRELAEAEAKAAEEAARRAAIEAAKAVPSWIDNVPGVYSADVSIIAEGLKGLGQGVLNTFNGIQDIAVGAANLGLIQANGGIWVLNQLGADLAYVSIPSPEWARGMLVHEGGTPGELDDMHGWSKWLGANGALIAIARLLPNQMTVSVGPGAASAQGGSGFHATFNVGGKWYHAGGNTLGQMTISRPMSANPMDPWFSSTHPILFPRAAAPLKDAQALTCVTAALSAWLRGGGLVFVIPPFIKPLNDLMQ